MPRKPISQYHPALYFIAVWLRRLHRYVAWYGDGRRYAAAQSTEKLAYQVKKHQSVLIKKLGDSDKHLDVVLSVHRAPLGGDAVTITVTTVVHVKNWLGHMYMLPVRPMHRLITPAVLSRLPRPAT